MRISGADTSTPDHWLDITPQEYLARHNNSVNPPKDLTSFFIRIHIRFEGSFFCLMHSYGVLFPYCHPTIDANYRQRTIRDGVLETLQASGHLSPRSLVELQFVERHQPSPIFSVENLERKELKLFVLMVAERREPSVEHVRSWLDYDAIDEYNEQNRKRGVGVLPSDQEFYDLRPHYLRCNKASRPAGSFTKLLTQQIIADRIRADHISNASEDQPLGFIVERITGTLGRTLLLLPRNQADFHAWRNTVRNPHPRSTYRHVGSWHQDGAVMLHDWYDEEWASLFRDDGALRMLWDDD